MDRGGQRPPAAGVIAPKAPVRIAYSVELAYEVRQAGADFILNIQAARTARQRVLHERLDITQPLGAFEHTDPATSSRLLRFRAGLGSLVVRYACEAEIAHAIDATAVIPQVWICNLPPAVLPYLYPSRYCESDSLNAIAMREFGSLPQGYERVRAIRDWVHGRVAFESGSSAGTTSAADTLATGRGVCRDFAHLMIALCRAVNIPARFATGLDFGSDPALGPTDFHAYVEVWLGTRWYVFDPSGTAVPLGLVRIGTGRDAADCAYATIFGDVQVISRWLTVESTGTRPEHTALAVSTDG
jgi:transglutaminase-like putative cysteine protease